MQPTTYTQVSQSPADSLNPVMDISGLANNILLCINGLASQEVALLVAGKPARMINPPGFPVEVLTDLQSMIEGDAAMPPMAQRKLLSDGSFIDAFPLVHAGQLEGILFLKGSKETSDGPLQQQRKVLNPICEVSAAAIAQYRRNNGAGERADSRALWLSSRLLGVVAHDIRSPIMVLRGYLKMMLSERTGSLTVDQKECLDGALNSTNQFMSLSGLVGGASGLMAQLHVEVLNLQQEVWRPSRAEVQRQAQEKSIVFKEQFPEEPFTVYGDRRILCDVVKKVIVRSVEFADPNTEVTVDLATRKTGEVVLRILFSGSSVGSQGQEVVSELLPLVFLHGGKLTLNSRNETESTFTLMLPGKDA